jgi:phosphoribosyl-ATP pyrophosphohydrolase
MPWVPASDEYRRQTMTDAVEPSDLEILNLLRCAPRKVGSLRGDDGPRQSNDAARVHLIMARKPGLQEPGSGVEIQSAAPSELDHLYRSFAGIKPESHPRTARLLASSARKIAQKVFEEAGEVAHEAVKRHTRAVVRESAELLYHLVALRQHACIDPTDVWLEMRRRADILGIAEKPPKARCDRQPPIHDIERPPEGNGA